MQERKQAAPGRIGWIDAAKGIGICLVVIGHVFPAGTLARTLFLFHMPMFFILAGLVFHSRPALAMARARALSLLVPYGAFLVAIAALFPADWRSLAWGGAALSGPFGVFWFPTALVAALLLYNQFCRWFGHRTLRLATACAACVVAAQFIPATTPLALGVAPMAVGFLWLGDMLRSPPGGWRPWLAVAGVFAACWGLAAALGLVQVPAVDMKHALYGPLLLGPMLSAAIAVLVLGIFRSLPARAAGFPPVRMLGGAAMTIMFLHQPVHFWLGAIPGIPALVTAAAAVLLPLGLHAAASRSRLLRTVFLGRPWIARGKARAGLLARAGTAIIRAAVRRRHGRADPAGQAESLASPLSGCSARPTGPHRG